MKNPEEKINKVFEDCDQECEGANYHGMIGLASEVYQRVCPDIIPGRHLQVAKAICGAITDSI